MNRKGCRISAMIFALAVVGIGIWVGPVVRDVVKAGFLERNDPVKYVANRTNNLMALYNALSLYQESEGAFPPAGAWMDAIAPRLRTSGMKKEEGEGKLIRPDLAGRPNEFGYALNPAMAEKYVGDVQPTDILVFESKGTARNQTETPELESGRMAVTVEGKVVDASGKPVTTSGE